MSHYTYLNGKLVNHEDASIPVGDIAIGRGYGIFDYFQIKNGVPLFMSEHLDRFIQSAEFMRLDFPETKEDLIEAIIKLIEKNHIERAGIKLLATGGEATDGLSTGKANVAILELPYYEPLPDIIQNGVKLLSYKYQRLLPHIKSTNYLYNVYLSDELKKAGAIEPLYYTQESVRETARANIFAVKDGTLITCADKMLEGINRGKVLKLGYPVEERNITLAELKAADEVFLTGTTKRALGVIQIDDHIIGNGKVGSLTMEIRQKLLDKESALIGAFKAMHNML